MLYADDIVLVAESRGDLEKNLEGRRLALESRGMRISREKTEYLTNEMGGDQQVTIRLDGINIKRVQQFKYLGSTIDASGNMKEEIKHRIQCGWSNWRKVSGVCCDRRVPITVKGKVHKAIVRPAMLYGLETAPLKK